MANAEPMINFTLRLPRDLVLWLDRRAVPRGVSRTAEIIRLLQAVREKQEAHKKPPKASWA